MVLLLASRRPHFPTSSRFVLLPTVPFSGRPLTRALVARVVRRWSDLKLLRSWVGSKALGQNKFPGLVQKRSTTFCFIHFPWPVEEGLLAIVKFCLALLCGCVCWDLCSEGSLHPAFSSHHGALSSCLCLCL